MTDDIEKESSLYSMYCYKCGTKIEWYENHIIYDKNCSACDFIMKIPLLKTEEEYNKHVSDYLETLRMDKPE